MLATAGPPILITEPLQVRQLRVREGFVRGYQVGFTASTAAAARWYWAGYGRDTVERQPGRRDPRSLNSI